jgi:hypothetical protein
MASGIFIVDIKKGLILVRLLKLCQLGRAERIRELIYSLH